MSTLSLPVTNHETRHHRFAILAYGLIAYAVFQGVFLYMIGFIEGVVVPKTMNGPTTTAWPVALLMNVALVSLFAIQHTIMARPVFKAWWTRIIPPAAERSTFVLTTCLILILLFWQWQPLPGVVWHVDATWARGILLALSLGGFGIVLLTSFLIDHFALFGLRQVWTHFRGTDMPAAGFTQRSLYRFVRHPLMTGFLIAFWATPDMTVTRLCFALLFTAYIFKGTRIEERDLVSEIGPAYDTYRRTTPMLIPRIGRRQY